MLNTAVVVHAGVIVLGVLWLREMPGRWRSDWHELRHAPEVMDRIVIGVIWLLSIYFLWSILGFVISAVSRVFRWV